MKISIFGLGYVGCVSAACLAEQGHYVVGVDINDDKVNMINRGQSPIIEQDLEVIIKNCVSAGRLRATTNALEGINDSDISLVCVGTPSNSNGSLNLQFVEQVCREIGQGLSEKKERHVVVLRSTMLPGSTEDRVIPALEDGSGLKAGQGFGVCVNPEFLREGTSIYDFHHPPFTLIGEHLEGDGDVVARLYETIDAPCIRVPLRVAEIVKYANNTFHALKICFANEIGNICKQEGVDSHQVMDIFCMDTKLNLSAYYLKPGFAFGGSCLPKDLRALLYHSRQRDLELPILCSILPSNEMQLQRGLELIKETGKKKIGVLGFSFKADTDDLRESPLVRLIETLIGKGYSVRLYDRNVSMAKLHGANKEYIEKEIPHISTLMCPSLSQVIEEAEVIIIGNKDPEFVQALEIARPDQIIIDLVRITDDFGQINSQYQGICW
jgi:GDP-mannose 6-dehydrogenase